MTRDIVFDPQTLSKRDRVRLADMVADEQGSHGLTIRLSVGGEAVTLPPKLAKAFAATIAEVADGHAIHVSRVDEELTTSEAAELLNVSRPYLVRLLDEGIIPHRKVGTHRRVRQVDVLAYRERSYQEAEQALQELADQAQEFGLGYE